jgi:hypothetical protein
VKKSNIGRNDLNNGGSEKLSKRLAVLGIIFHRAVFAATFLLYILLIIIDYVVDIIPTPWGMYLFIPVIIFGLIGYLIDEMQ